jgi:hypothetical protein
VAVDARRVLVVVRVRRLVGVTNGCRWTFREQVPGVLEGINGARTGWPDKSASW